MISIIIPTYMNKQFLSNTRMNIKFFSGCEVIIVNDNPKESLKNDLKEFKNIRLLENNSNLGFAQSINKGVRMATKKYVMLINDDVLLLDDSFKKATYLFEKYPLLFAVSFAQKEKDNSIVGKNILYWKRGLIFHAKAKNLKFGYSAWAEGGACLIDKNKFLQLGGFDPIYAPFYWEDIDLCYQAWKKGFKILFDPKILVEHHHESTIGKYFSRKFIQTIAFRNQFIFVWKNISDLNLLLKHFLLLFYNLLYYSIVKRQSNFLRGFFQAVKDLPAIITRRKLTNKDRKERDKKILASFSL